MPRDGAGVYTKAAGVTAVAGQTIESAKFNDAVDDLVQDANSPRPIGAGGTGQSNATDARKALGVNYFDLFLTSNEVNTGALSQYDVNRGSGASVVPVVDETIWVQVHDSPVTNAAVQIRLTDGTSNGDYFPVNVITGGGNLTDLTSTDINGALFISSARLRLQFNGSVWVIIEQNVPVGTGSRRMLQLDSSGKIPDHAKSVVVEDVAAAVCDDGATASLVVSENLTLSRIQEGQYRYSFGAALSSTAYGLTLGHASSQNNVGYDAKTVNGFDVFIRDSAGDLTDSAHDVRVWVAI